MQRRLERVGITSKALSDLGVDLLPRVRAKPDGVAAKGLPDAELKPVDGLATFNAEYSEPTFLIYELLARGVTLLAGRPKVGKSWLTLQIALAVAFRQTLWGRFGIESAGRVVYLALEEPAKRTNARLKKLIDKADARLQNIDFVYGCKPLMAGGAVQIEQYCAKNHPDLVVIDTLLSVLLANAKRDVLRSDYAEINLLRQLAEKHNAAFLIVHHLRKMGAEYSLDGVAGTTGLTAACDAVWTLKRQASGKCLLEVTGREMEEQAYTLRFDSVTPFGWKLHGEGEQARLSDERREILELLRHEAPLTPGKIALMLKKNVNTIRWLVGKLAEDGFLVRGTGRKYRLSPSTTNSTYDGGKS